MSTPRRDHSHGVPMNSPEFWYLTLRRDTRTVLLLGPFSTRVDAEVFIEWARQAAYEVDVVPLG